MSDIFHEVDEEVRREQLKKLWERYQNYVVALAIAAVLGVGGWRAWDWWEAKKAAETGARSTRQRRGYYIESRNKFREKERPQAVSDEEIFSPAYARVRLDRHFADELQCLSAVTLSQVKPDGIRNGASDERVAEN